MREAGTRVACLEETRVSPATMTDSSSKSRLTWQGVVGFFAVFAGLCTVFGVIITAGEAWQEHAQAAWPVATAQVEECGVGPTSSGNSYYITCRLSYAVGAEKLETNVHSRSVLSPTIWTYPRNQVGVADLQEWADEHPPGTPIAVHYDPGNPKKAVLVATDMPLGGPRTPANLRLLGLAALSCIVLLTIARLVRPRSGAV
jgi:hypothetical protein